MKCINCHKIVHLYRACPNLGSNDIQCKLKLVQIRSRRNQPLVAPKWYNYADLMCYSLGQSKEIIKMTKKHDMEVWEVMMQLVKLPKILR